MYMRILFTKSGGSNELSIYLSEGCRNATGIIVAATIRAIEGARSRRRRRGSKGSFKEEFGPGGSAISVEVLKPGRDSQSLPTAVGSKQLKQDFLIIEAKGCGLIKGIVAAGLILCARGYFSWMLLPLADSREIPLRSCRWKAFWATRRYRPLPPRTTCRKRHFSFLKAATTFCVGSRLPRRYRFAATPPWPAQPW